MQTNLSDIYRLLPTESIDRLVEDALSTKAWEKAQDDFNRSKTIYIIGNGGNLAVADHGSVDITRLSKTCNCSWEWNCCNLSNRG